MTGVLVFGLPKIGPWCPGTEDLGVFFPAAINDREGFHSFRLVTMAERLATESSTDQGLNFVTT
jgi:hypothetical protein